MASADNTDREVDIVLVILDLVRAAAPAITAEQTRDVEQAVRVKYGGQRVRIAKRKKHLTPEQRDQLVRQALDPASADLSTDQIADTNGIHRSTLYRAFKRRGL
ncbi:MAG: hypothetical protein V4706_01860 [Pseudomonadota bacterium]